MTDVRIRPREPLALRVVAGIVVAGIVAALSWGCTRHAVEIPAAFDENAFELKTIRDYDVRLPAARSRLVASPMVGTVARYRIRNGDTLLDVARYYDLGYNEIVAANPDIDPWNPQPGSTVVLPTAWILPCCTFAGIVVNVPEMRLYFYRHDGGDPEMVRVVTHPVAVGRVAWPTPRGRWRVRAKTVNPRWDIPASIRAERIRERGDARRFIAGGEPDNPLGGYRIALTLPHYAIHSTNVPWGIGREVSHGCVQLYPEDIDKLFPQVDVGTPVDVTYKPVKVGVRGRDVYVEVHADLYGYGSPTKEEIIAELAAANLATSVDAAALDAALDAARGVPVRISRR